ncbi:hypothetical protein C8Q79DRAFT_305353 [Trametes meyenii]|nr:hypothetical protein C8Q79DRAFT_305353 [Trametes meyenii]
MCCRYLRLLSVALTLCRAELTVARLDALSLSIKCRLSSAYACRGPQRRTDRESRRIQFDTTMEYAKVSPGVGGYIPGIRDVGTTDALCGGYLIRISRNGQLEVSRARPT